MEKKRSRSVYISHVSKDGTLRGGCYHCAKSDWVPMARFAPADSNLTHCRFTKFKEALGGFDVAFKAGDKETATARRAEIISRQRRALSPYVFFLCVLDMPLVYVFGLWLCLMAIAYAYSLCR